MKTNFSFLYVPSKIKTIRVKLILFAIGFFFILSSLSADRVTSVLLADNSQVQNVYDDAGRLRERIITASPGLGGATHEYFDYDDLDRLVKARNDFSTVDFVYNAQGRLEKETQRLVSHNLPAVSFDVTYQYDANGNKTKIDYPSGSQLTIRPDDLDRIRDVTTAGFLAEYTYEGRDKVVGKNFANAMRLTVRHDDGRRPESVEFKGQGDRLLVGRDLVHDKKDLKTEETKKDDANRKTTYNYDPVARLVKAEQDLRARFNTFDAADNLTRQAERNKTVTEVKEAEYNSRNQRLVFGLARLAYDDNGNLKSIQPRATSPNDWTYTYDYANRLVKAMKANGDITEYVYDALGRRARKVFTDGQTHQVTVVTYAYDGDQVIEERDANEALLARYIYGNGIDEPLCIERPNPLTGQLNKYLPMQDTNGNIMGLANLSGILVEKVRYTESGEAVFEYDHVPPQVDVARVASGNLRIRFSEPVDQTKATSAIKVLDGANPIAGTVAFEDEDRLAIFTPTSPIPQAVTLTLKITIDLEDTSGNALAEEFNHTFSYQGADLSIYDRLPPEVERAEYASGNFSITLTEEYDPTTLTNTVEIISPTQTIGGTVTADGPRKLSFSPSQSLQNETEYTLKVKTSIKDLAGKSLIEFTKVFIFDNTDHLLFEKPNQKEHGESYVKNTTLFQGREYDPETGLYYFRARYYAPKLSMFIQPDPMGYEDSMNLYQGMGNNPVNFMDPMGLQEKESFVLNSMAAKGYYTLDEVLQAEEAVRRYQGKAIKAGAIGFAMAQLSVPAAAAVVGTTLFYGGLENAVARKASGQSESQASRGALLDTLTFGLYSAITGRDPGTKQNISLSSRIESIGDTLINIMAGGLGFSTGCYFKTENIPTSQLINETYSILRNIPQNGTLSNLQARLWYLEQEKRIPSQVDQSLSLFEKAKQSFEIRNKLRTKTRDLMSDRIEAERLMRQEKNLTFEELVQKAISKGYKGDDIYKYIYESSQRSRKSTNRKFGIE